MSPETKNISVDHSKTLLTDYDIHLFKEGSHFHLHHKLGSHLAAIDGVKGVYFAVWAPNAERVTVIGNFNSWDNAAHPLEARWDGSGIWEGFIPGLEKGEIYKYHIVSRAQGLTTDKGDPYAYHWELSPRTASAVWDLEYDWQDGQWMKDRHKHNNLHAPQAIYELHTGSWRRVPEEGNRYMNYREMAHWLADYINETGFTHVELLPIMEHPFYGSWGYQTVGYFAPTSRFGTPQDFMYMIDYLHRHDIGVILDWVPSHFPADQHGLVYFDGTHLYEHADPRKGFHPDWETYIFNYGRHEVREFLISNALYWLEYYHIDGLRVDAVASMLYMDYSRKHGEWIPNDQGGRENLEAIHFLRRFNEAVYAKFPDVQTIAEESTAWPMVSRPVYTGGLGFGMKWNMGWMHDVLEYMSKDPIYRKYHHNQLTFSLMYAFTENYVLPFSHDEVVYGKGSLIEKMPGDEWQKFANLRLLLGFMYGHPGKKLLFMGGEFGQWQEWAHERSLDWHLMDHHYHKGMWKWMCDLNRLYRSEPALYERDFSHEGFQWIDCNDYEKSIIAFMRHGHGQSVVIICNFTPSPSHNYRIGVSQKGFWRELINSDARQYGGSGQGNLGGMETVPVPCHGFRQSLSITVPPLSITAFKHE